MDLDEDGIEDLILWNADLKHGLSSVHTRIIYWKRPQDERPVITEPLMYGYMPALKDGSLSFTSLTSLGLSKECLFKKQELDCEVKKSKTYSDFEHHKFAPY
jgi:hypothetical protein